MTKKLHSKSKSTLRATKKDSKKKTSARTKVSSTRTKVSKFTWRCNESLKKVFYTLLRRKLVHLFEGYIWTEIKDDEVKRPLFDREVNALMTSHGIVPSPLVDKKIRDMLLSIRRTQIRRQQNKAQTATKKGQQAIMNTSSSIDLSNLLPEEELKAPEFDRYTRGRTPLPTPGLQPGSNIRSKPDKFGFTVYKERDLPFASQLQQLLKDTKIDTIDNQDFETEDHHISYMKDVMTTNVYEFVEIIHRAPNFEDEHRYAVVNNQYIDLFTFSWRHICKTAETQQMHPFDMLAYATLFKLHSNGKIPVGDYLDRVSASASDWHHKIPGSAQAISLGLSCPFVLYLLGGPNQNLSSQVLTVRTLYNDYLFHSNFNGSHALFLDFALKARRGLIDFDVEVAKLDPTQIENYENEYFNLCERFVTYHGSSTCLTGVGINGPVPLVMWDWVDQQDAVQEDEEVEYFNQPYGFVRDYDRDDHDVNQLVSLDDLNIIYIADNEASNEALFEDFNDSSTVDSKPPGHLNI